ncbi:MAG: hypothetical protein HYY50_01570 [Candidatus Kerfeldbacteria bacterium]|nr:hypothetical protein [Candidatus Kerfeldbacteria bacterium]
MIRKGFSFAETLIVGSLFALAVLLGTLLLSGERARTRDAKRIADMTRVAGAMAVLYAQQASYASAAQGCAKIGDAASACTFAAAPGWGELQDPGRFSYTVVRVPDGDDFGVRFRLERNYGPLRAGPHVVTKTGIH